MAQRISTSPAMRLLFPVQGKNLTHSLIEIYIDNDMLPHRVLHLAFHPSLELWGITLWRECEALFLCIPFGLQDF